MIATLSPKLLGFLTAGVSVPLVGGVVYVAWPSKAHTLLLVNAETATTTQPADELKFGNDQNYKCKLGNKVDEYCTIEEFEPNSSKKWDDLANLNKAKATNTTLNKATLATANKFYKVRVSSDLVNSINWSTNTDKLEILSKTDSSTNNKYATLTPLMSFGHKTAKTTNQLYLAQAKAIFSSASTNTSVTVGSSPDYKCVLSESDISDTAKHKDCSIYKFADSQTNPKDYKSLTYTASEASETSVTKSNYYLVKFNSPLTDEEVKSLSIFYISKSSTDSSTSTVTWSKTVEFKPTYQAIQAPTVGDKKLFILA